jgi:hypothetical protein
MRNEDARWLGWTLDNNSPKRDRFVSVEDEAAAVLAPQAIPWRYKFMRLWRFVTRQ